MPLPTLTVPLRGRGRPRTQAPKIQTVLISSDYHAPFVDWPTYHAMRHFLSDIRPDYHVINGDAIDAFELSRFSKDPHRFGQTVEELEIFNNILDELYEASPTTITKFIAGNHSARITNRFYDNADLLALVSPTRDPNDVLIQALGLKQRGISYLPYREVLDIGGFLITHGEAYGIHPSQAELKRYGMSGVSGHCHRNTSFEMKNRRGFAKWWTIGGLCRHDMDYRPTNDWNNGIGLYEGVVGTDLFQFHQIEIIGGRFLFQGKLYDQDGVHSSL